MKLIVYVTSYSLKFFTVWLSSVRPEEVIKKKKLNKSWRCLKRIQNFVIYRKKLKKRERKKKKSFFEYGGASREIK